MSGARQPIYSKGKVTRLVILLLGALCLLIFVPDGATAAGSCQILPGGTIGDREPPPVADRAGSPTDTGPGAKGANPTVKGLPARVDLRSSTAGSNRNWYFAVRDGRLFVKPNYERTGRRGQWQRVETPSCLDGDIKSIDVDDDELIALNSKRQIFGLDQALSIPSRFNWSSRWGFPFWTGDGFTVADDTVAWAWTVISPRESGYWLDPAGNRHPVGEGKVSHILSVPRDRRRITMNDPWLPRDRSYEICTPRRGSFVIQNIAASGSVVFVIGRHGDMFTRLWDFDIAGLDSTFFNYSYEDQRGLPDPAIQLPGAHWVQQPKIRGRITDRISITTVGHGTEHRTLRVEGHNRKGVPGFWQKDLYVLNRGSAGWKFIPTPKAKLTGRRIPNPSGDTAAVAAGPVEGYRFSLAGGSLTAEIPDFNIYCGQSVLRLGPADGEQVDLPLHIDESVRIMPRERGLDASPRNFRATIEVTDQARERAARVPEAERFINEVLGGKRFVEATAEVSTESLTIPGLGLTFNGAGPQPRACIPDPGFRRIGLSAKGRKLKFSLEPATESPAHIVIRRTSARGRIAHGPVAARLTRNRDFTWKDSRPRSRANGLYRVELGSMGPRGQLDTRGFRLRRVKGKYRFLKETTGARNCSARAGSQ